MPGFVQIYKVLELKSHHFPGLENHGIRPRYWKVVERHGATNFSMISVNDY